jgi:hypothetical protein
MKQAYVKGTSIKIVATQERVYGIASLSGFDEHNQPVYAGGTSIDWDSQEPVINPDTGSVVYVDEYGDEHNESDLEFREEE